MPEGEEDCGHSGSANVTGLQVGLMGTLPRGQRLPVTSQAAQGVGELVGEPQGEELLGVCGVPSAEQLGER